MTVTLNLVIPYTLLLTFTYFYDLRTNIYAFELVFNCYFIAVDAMFMAMRVVFYLSWEKKLDEFPWTSFETVSKRIYSYEGLASASSNKKKLLNSFGMSLMRKTRRFLKVISRDQLLTEVIEAASPDLDHETVCELVKEVQLRCK